MNLAGERKRFEWLLRPVAGTLSSLPLSPNQLTLAGLVFGLASAALYASGALAFAGVALLFHSLFDLADGYVARAKKQSTVFGAVFDGLSDRYVNGLILLAITSFAWNGSYPLLGLGMLATVGSLVNSFAKTQTYAEAGSSTRVGGRIESAMEGIGVYGFAECVITLLAFTAATLLLNIPLMGIALGVVAAGSHLSLIQRLMYVGEKFGSKRD